ncbi:hypothetical protein OWR29_14840 [Actinoplanes sp. Pm04-4]|uniref:PBS lyase HEAT domain protein repeat-containing protein n=1 Tax=Paractinoplanes pyxinae TaxID=2997416 RepID=A0ABT4AYI7_9ACTN|nr:hypothetical protein [Actinoplanes pyxinae]MCY1139274.1 hypothetical protein [Actinoplanes pyxinae]
MFSGMDDIDWGRMRHAYGPATQVPGWVRGLVDLDPAVREESLDAMYGAVHHQGDVYKCTVEAVPFLLKALTTPSPGSDTTATPSSPGRPGATPSSPGRPGATPSSPGRLGAASSTAASPLPGRHGIAELLASIAGAELGDGGAMDRRIRKARKLIAAAAPALAVLAADPDPAVRAAMAKLLPEDVLLDRLAVEDDPVVLRALLDGLSETDVPTDLLLAAAANSLLASTSVAALVAVARKDPEQVPADELASRLERAYAEEAEPAASAGFRTDTLIGSVRVATEKLDAGRRAPHAARLIDQLTDALGPRVPLRIEMLEQLLRSPHADIVQDALFGTGKLIDRWRGDYRVLVHLVAGHLTHPDGRIRDQAARLLSHWYPLTAPVADPVHAALVALPDWLVRYQSGPPGLHPAVEILGALGDERALPYLLETLTFDQRPRSTPGLLAHYPQAAIEAILPLLPSPDFHAVLRAAGPAAAPAVPALLEMPLDDAAALTLGAIGPAASVAVPALRAAASGTEERLAVNAAGALWRILGDPDVLPLLVDQLGGRATVNALEQIGAMGPAASAAVPAVRPFLDGDAQAWWLPTRAAIALWRLTSEPGRALPVLTAAWNANPHTRPAIADAASGPLAAGLAPLFQAELDRPQRHGVSSTTWSSNQVATDERLTARLRTFVQPRAS